jgi:preprotein translocase subunit SecD
MTIARRNLQLAIALIPILIGTSCQRNAPQPLAKSAILEVYQVSPNNTASSRAAVDPESGSQVYLTLPPVIASADVATVERAEDSHDQFSLTVHLTPQGAQKMSAATTPAQGQELAIVVNGQVMSVAKVRSPISKDFSISGGSLNRERETIFAVLTEE